MGVLIATIFGSLIASLGAVFSYLEKINAQHIQREKERIAEVYRMRTEELQSKNIALSEKLQQKSDTIQQLQETMLNEITGGDNKPLIEFFGYSTIGAGFVEYLQVQVSVRNLHNTPIFGIEISLEDFDKVGVDHEIEQATLGEVAPEHQGAQNVFTQRISVGTLPGNHQEKVYDTRASLQHGFHQYSGFVSWRNGFYKFIVTGHLDSTTTSGLTQLAGTVEFFDSKGKIDPQKYFHPNAQR